MTNRRKDAAVPGGGRLPAFRLGLLALAMAGALGAAVPVMADEGRKEIFEQLLEKLRDKGILSDDEVGAFKQAREAEKAEERARLEEAVRSAQPAPIAPQPAPAAVASPAPEQRVATATPVPLAPPAEAAKCGPDDPDGIALNVCPWLKSAIVDGDVRLRYEARQGVGAPNAVLAGTGTNSVQRDRWRYAFRLGLSGDLNDAFYYGTRLETATNPRSPWLTFGAPATNTVGTDTPFSKNNGGLNLGRLYLGWHATPWLNVQAGKMPNPLYTTPMVWDPDLNPEGVAERASYTFGNGLNLFANFGQFIYQDTNPDTGSGGLGVHRRDSWLYASQAGVNWQLAPDLSAKAAVTLHQYNLGDAGAFNNDAGDVTTKVFTGAGAANGTNVAANQVGINDLKVLELPWELNFSLLQRRARLFGDFAVNLEGGARARDAGTPAYQDDRKALQVGLAYGTMDLTNGGTRLSRIKQGVWEARTYYQRVEEYALDPNMTDSDFMEGRTNLAGMYMAVAYSPADAIITTVRYGYAHRVNDKLPTGGANSDLSGINPITDYRILQFDLTWKF